MKSFNRLREESLEEKLKASDPAGKWISDFVHSDNPKFAGKSKKERIRMALGASYAAKRQNEDNNHIVEATHRIGLTVTDPNHPMVSKRKETIQKTVRVDGEDRESAIKRAMAHYRRKGYKVHDHHYIGTVNEEVELVEKYTENDIANGGTVIYKHEGKHYMSKVSHKTGGGAGTKIHTTSSLGHVVPLHNVVSTDASDWNTYKNRSVKEEVQIDEMMTPAETYKKLAVKHLRDSMDKSATQKQRDHAKMMNRRALEAAKMSNHTDALNHYRGMKEEVENVAEGSVQDKLYQQHQAIRAANKRPNPEYYKELGMSYDIKDDKERIAKQAEIKKKYKVEGAQLDQLKTMRDDPKWQGNPEHKAQLDKRLKMAQDRADLDKGEVTDASGKPVPVLTPDKFKEKNPNFMKEEGEYPHQGVGVSRSMQMAADIARQKARTSLMQSKYGSEFQDKAMPDYDEDKMDLRPGSSPGTYQATVRMRERMKQESFSSLRNKIAEAKKMKGEDPCWDDYKMIGTKMKNGKQVPNCVPKESVAEGKEEQEYDYEGDMAMSDLRSILHNAKTVHDMLKPNTNIPEWCQSKITLAEDYMSTVANYMRGEMTEAVSSAQQAAIAINMKKKGMKPKNEEVEQIEEKVLERLFQTVHNSGKNEYVVNSSVHQHPDEKHYNTNTLIHKGTINNKKFEASVHVNRGVEFHTKHSPEEKKSIIQHFDRNKYLSKHNKAMTNEEVEQIDEAKPGLYANIHAKRKRIKSGSGERMRKPGTKGAPTAQAFKDSAKTAKK